jgi:nucleoid-associated protein YgaU
MRHTTAMMLCGFLVMAFAAIDLSAQSLLDNDYYTKARSLILQSETALESGDYDSAALLATESRENFTKSDDYVAAMLLFYRANGWLYRATERVAYAASIDADRNYPDAYAAATGGLAAAKAAMEAKDYPACTEECKAVLAALEGIAPAVAESPEPAPVEPAQRGGLPEYYTVRLVLPLRDCFWRIAAYPFVYNDPWKWRLLYDANRPLLAEPANPDLIEVGARILIPSAKGETRTGDYDPRQEYPALE